MVEVLRRTSLVPLALPCFVLSLIGVETEGRLDYQRRGGRGIISIVRWSLRPVIFGVELQEMLSDPRLLRLEAKLPKTDGQNWKEQMAEESQNSETGRIRVSESTVLPGSVTSIYFRFRINYRYIYITVTSN